jgi:hypothetical protein
MAITSNNTDAFAVTVAGGSTSTTLFDGAFGDGSDGNGNITGGTTTLTREWHYNNLTITGTGILKPRGHRIFVKGVLTINAGGSINDDGVAGGTGVSGGTALSNLSTASLGAGSGAGGAGRTTTGAGLAGATSSNCSTNNVAAQPIGGVGGGVSAPVVAGGTAGAAPVPTISQKWNSLASIWSGRLYNGSSTFNGGSGGGGGGCDLTGGTGTSGNGGSGGGIVHIGAKTVANAGSITANGGAGGNGVATGTASAGAGAGGGGGLVTLITTTTASFGTVTANAGAVGTGAGVAPTAATVGQPGSVAILVLS